MYLYSEKISDKSKGFNRHLRCDVCEVDVLREASKCVKMLETYGKDLCRSCSVSFRNRQRDPSIQRKMVEKVASNRRGKTITEIFGKIEADRLRAVFSANNMGENNPNFGGKYCKGFADRPPTGKWEDRYGKEKADRMRKNLSASISGAGNPMFGKPSPVGSSRGWSGWYKDFYFYSRFELNFILFMEQQGIAYATANLPELRVPYVLNGTQRSYIPDFYLPDTGTVIELKPKKFITDEKNLAKFKAASEQFGDKFAVVTEDDFKIVITYEMIKEKHDLMELKFTTKFEEKFKTIRHW